MIISPVFRWNMGPEKLEERPNAKKQIMLSLEIPSNYVSVTLIIETEWFGGSSIVPCRG